MRVEPLDDAVDVKDVRAVSPDEWTVVTRQRAVRTAGFKSHTTNAAVVVISNPFPNCNTRPAYDESKNKGK